MLIAAETSRPHNHRMETRAGESHNLIDLAETPDEELLAQIYSGLYKKSFQREEERESLASLSEGLWNDSGPVRAHFFVALQDGEPAAVDGFVACEYYPTSHCGLISYLAVEEAARGRGLGRALVKRAIEALGREADDDRVPLDAVFGEIHDPAKVQKSDDVMSPFARLRVMDRLGARRVPIAYVQPSLAPGQMPARSLMLVAFPPATDPRPKLRPDEFDPQPSTGARRYRLVSCPSLRQLFRSRRSEVFESLPTAVVRGFLTELYAALDVATDSADLDRAFIGLDGDSVELEPLAIVERPRVSFSEFGIGFHFPVTSKKAHGSTAELASFEEDMLAYAYVHSPPFQTLTMPVPSHLAQVSVRFPAAVAFVSEGRAVLLRTAADEDRTLKFLVRAARTDFRRSGLSILHLVLGPTSHTGPRSPRNEYDLPNEYDLIKLGKLWTGGEGIDPTSVRDAAGEQYATFLADGKEYQKLSELAADIFSELVDSPPRAGTVQLLHPACPALSKEMQEIKTLEGAASASPEAVAAGGLIQGLLDFVEIDADELADVFREVDAEKELISSLHKGTLLVASEDDRAFSAENVRQSVGLSPYLFIPHAVLAHNEHWVEDAIGKLDSKPVGWNSVGLARTRQLARTREDVSDTLARKLVPNVFHYHEQRQLYARGSQDRALDERITTVKRRLDALDAEITSRHNAIRSAVAATIPLLALVFTWLDALSKYDHAIVAAVLIPTTILTLVALLLALRGR